MAKRRKPVRGLAKLHQEPDYQSMPEAFTWLIWFGWGMFFIFHPFLAMYILPSAINFANRYPQSMRSLALNLFFGWTPIWVIFICQAISNIGKFPRRDKEHERDKDDTNTTII